MWQWHRLLWATSSATTTFSARGEKNLSELKPSCITEAALAFDAQVKPEYRSIFNEIFSPLASVVPKLGTDSITQAKKLRGLIRIVHDIPTGSKQNYVVLGYVYEYLISHFAANAGKSAGEFYTLHQVALVMAEIVGHHLRGRKEIQVYENSLNLDRLRALSV
ncbi:N-6 DNA methylase [Cutibacterium acnes]|nr:N-6 DNA methylase [Cutibacterium acnes]WGH39594.1 N-6 DNA methylase [Cutibacterium acnes]